LSVKKPSILAHSLAAPPGNGGGLQARSSAHPWQYAALAFLSLTAVAAFGTAPDTVLDTVPTRIIERALPPPVITGDDEARIYWREERVQRGDTLGSLLARAGVDDADAMQYLRTDPQARPLYQLKPGRPVQVATDEQGDLVALRFLTNAGDRLVVERVENAFRSERSVPTEEIRTTLRSGEIESSLFGAADAAGIPDRVIAALADIFAGEIDFYHDVQRGDRFSVVYEMRYVDGEVAGSGRILAAEFVNRGSPHRAFYWRNADGTGGYYSDIGRNSRNAFLRSPMELTRITSGFTMARFHPIFQDWREHKGVDYAAPKGTPVRVTADGVIEFAGWQNGYGNVIFVKHQGNYSTVYGHLSKFADELKPGTRVLQGDTIGFVGMTGWATGPHLHYEFRVAGEPRDPMTASAVPDASPLNAERLPEFRAAIAPLVDSLALARSLPGAALASTE
jgi:murein DD-endopeptidase MepM/ murein hydrolase activator NlpD